MEADTILVDLDGTLADIRHRLPLIQRDVPDWDAFYAACFNDKPKQWCVELIFAMIAAGFNVKIVSARSKTVEATTVAWLREKTDLGELLDSGKLTLNMIRQSNKDYTPDQDLKRKWLYSFGKEKVLFVVDDRQRVVDMWRAEGLTCLQCDTWPEYKRAKKEKPNASPVA